ncbi:MAG TPA: ATP-binding protein, partial [Thermotogota bacterium]|nr:ATP-binding protein [Thermotogota bacterium]
MKRSNGTLQATIFRNSLLLILVPLLTLGFLVFFFVRTRLESEMLQKNAFLAESEFGQVDFFLREQESFLQKLSVLVSEGILDHLAINTYLQEAVRSIEGLERVLILDGEGTCAFSSGPHAEGVGNDFSLQPFFLESVESSKISWSSSFIPLLGDAPIVAVSFRQSGFVFASLVDLSSLMQSPWLHGETDLLSVSLMDRYGVFVAHTRPEMVLQRQQLDLSLLAKWQGQQEQGNTLQASFPFGDQLVHFRFIPRTNWSIMIGESYARSMKSLRDVQWFFFLVLLVSVGISFLLSRRLSQRLGRAMGTLVKYARSFATGDFCRVSGSFPYTELEELVGAMNRMAEEIKQREQNLEKQGQTLEIQNNELKRLNMELQAFSYSVSHDLRAPLRSLDGFSQAILEDYADRLDETGKDYLRRIRLSSKKMARLIDDILQLSRVSRKELVMQNVDLNQLAKSSFQAVMEWYPDSRVLFVLPDPPVQVRGDYRLLQLVMQNLLANAVKFTSGKPDPRVWFGETRNEGKREFFVRDNGVGFDMNFVSKIFDPFQRLHTEREFPGTGIGLSLVKRIITRHGGYIRAEGEVGVGATIT